MAFVFPGQGAQYVGMGKDLAEAFPEARSVITAASEVLGFDLARMCWEGPDETLTQTENAQPAILATSIAALRVVRSRLPAPAVTAGLSLGEYTALVCVEALDFADAVRLVRSRGQCMADAVSGLDTAMAALLGLDASAVERVCADAGSRGIVEPANFNGPGQIVIAGEAAAVEYAIELAKGAGAKRAVKLAVSAPFHTSLMQPAADRLAPLLRQVPVRAARMPVISNVSAQPVQAPDEIRRLLIAQVATAVRWEQSVRTMADRGITTFVEIGPGTTLSGLIRKSVPGATVLNVEDIASLEETIAVLEAGARSAH